MTPKRTIKSGSYTFPMNWRERERLLESMTPDARAWFYDREMEAHKALRAQEEADAKSVD